MTENKPQTVTVPTAGDQYFRQSHAFIVGINDYQHVSPLRTATNDAERLATELESKHGYHTYLLLNPTKIQLEAFIKKTLTLTVQKDDRVIFYFAGHGIASDAPEGEEGKPQGYLVPTDAKSQEEDSMVKMDLLNQHLNALPSRHVLLILDCCFAGSFEWAANRTRSLGSRLPKKIFKERFDRYIKDPAWQVITSSAHDQKALDVLTKRPVGERGEENGNHSPFALSLFEALDGAADVVPADGNDGVITASELYIYLRDKVESQSISEAEKLRQTPKLFNLERHDKGEFIFFHPKHALNLDPIPKRNPYMGLKSFEEEDADLFYGRDEVVQALQAKVKTTNFLVVTGASGTGKSSVIKAGLIPIVREKGFRILPTIRPTRYPLQALSAVLAEAKIMEPDTDLSKGVPDEIVEKLLAQKTLILVDQYEELITQCNDAQARQLFIDFLRRLIESGKPENMEVVITVRADFEPQFEKMGLEKHWMQARFTVPPFGLDQLMEVIEKPAIQEVLMFDPPEMVSEIANEVIQAPGALPLLSFLLSELYLKCYQEGRRLTREAYEELGGVVGSLRTRADALHESLDKPHRQTMRQVMIRMISLEAGEIASRRVFLDELNYHQEVRNAQVESVLKKLSEARLVVQGKDSQGKIYVEPAHDALVRAWATLWEWVKAFGEDNLRLQRRLHEAVKDAKNTQPAILENGKKLKIKEQSALLWEENPNLDNLYAETQSKQNWLNAQETTFVEASHRLRKRIKRKRRQELILAFTLLGALAIGATIAFFIAESRRKQAERESYANRMVALSLEIPDEYPVLKMRLLNQAYEAVRDDRENYPTIEWARSRIVSKFGIPGQDNYFHYGQILNDVESQLMSNAETEQMKTLLKNGGFESKADCQAQYGGTEQIRISPFGDMLLALEDVQKGGGMVIWDLLSGTEINRIQSNDYQFTDALFLPDGSGILACDESEEIKFLGINGDPIAGKNIKHPDYGVQNLAVSPNGKYLATGGANRLALWDLKSNKKISDLAKIGEDNPEDMALFHSTFSEDGKYFMALVGDYNLDPDYNPSVAPAIEDYIYAVIAVWSTEAIVNSNDNDGIPEPIFNLSLEEFATRTDKFGYPTNPSRYFQEVILSPSGELVLVLEKEKEVGSFKVFRTNDPGGLGNHEPLYIYPPLNTEDPTIVLEKMAFLPDESGFVAQNRGYGVEVHRPDGEPFLFLGMFDLGGKAILMPSKLDDLGANSIFFHQTIKEEDAKSYIGTFDPYYLGQ